MDQEIDAGQASANDPRATAIADAARRAGSYRWPIHPGMGRFIDLAGARFGYAITFTPWTLAHMAHRPIHSVAQFGLVRFAPGIGLATVGHQAFSANLPTLPSDLFLRAAVGSVVGIDGTAGATDGMAIARFVGYALDLSGSHAPIVAVAGSARFAALLALHLLGPRLVATRAGLDPLSSPETLA